MLHAKRFFVFLVLLSLTTSARADEGMWLPNAPPRDALKQTYDFEPSDAWLTHLQHSAVRFNNGGSGSFVSADGLVMTNHHVGATALQKLSTAEHDYIQNGFLARTRQEELKCHDLELNVLVNIEDVTARVQAAVTPTMKPDEANLARRAVMTEIEQESVTKTGLRSDVVTLYQGGLYHLYRYRRYTDVRLVFAPEQDIAFFGGDPDNFEYPRYDLDVCFFRVYENDQPAKIADYLKWSTDGVRDQELVIVAGHPGHTSRLDTTAHLTLLRDTILPARLNLVRRQELALVGYSQRSLENTRRAQRALFGFRNSRKALEGRLAGLQDPAVFAKKVEEERALRTAVAQNAQLAQADGKAWDHVATGIDEWKPLIPRQRLLEQAAAFDSTLFSYARWLVRLAEEKPKPTAERLREYRDSNLPSLEQQLFSTAPIYKDMETVKLADSLSYFVEQVGADDPLVQQVLAGKSPQQRAAELVDGTKLDDPAVRKQLAQAGLAGVETSQDPMLQFARLVDPASRAVREKVETQVEEPLLEAYARIAQARFALGGTKVYPDATFTLRFAFGTVAGYRQDTEQLPPWTTLGGAYQHAAQHQSQPPFNLPPSWLEHKDQLNLDTPMNFVSTNDIIGGNSGSPVVNRRGELVGLIFDGNRHSLVWEFVFDDQQGRALSVDSRALLETLWKIYGAQELVGELVP